MPNFSAPTIPLRFSTGGSLAPQQEHMPKGQDLDVLVNALNFLLSIQANAQTDVAYTIQASDNGKVITFNNAGAITVTVPAGLGNFSCGVLQIGAGQVTFQAGAGVSLNGSGGHLALANQWAAGSLLAYAADSFVLAGNTA